MKCYVKVLRKLVDRERGMTKCQYLLWSCLLFLIITGPLDWEL